MFELTPFVKNHGLSSFNPFREMEEFEKRFFGDKELFGFRTDIQDQGDSYLLEAELPGFKKEDIHIDIDQGTLTISAERRYENKEEDKNGRFIHSERSYGSFARSFDISSVKEDAISAAYEDGILKLTMPKKEKNIPTSRRLEIG